MNEELTRRYNAAMHRMQSAVAYALTRKPKVGEPKHLRVGLNSMMAQQGGLVTLLIAKGVITEDEYELAMVEAAEAEAEARVKEARSLGNLPETFDFA